MGSLETRLLACSDIVTKLGSSVTPWTVSKNRKASELAAKNLLAEQNTLKRLIKKTLASVDAQAVIKIEEACKSIKVGGASSVHHQPCLPCGPVCSCM